MGDSNRWQQDSTGWGDGRGWQRDSTGWRDSAGWQQDSTGWNARGWWQSDSHMDRSRRDRLPPAGLEIGQTWIHGDPNPAERARQMEYETNRSNPRAGARFPESQVLRLLWPYSVNQMNNAVHDADRRQPNFWRLFKEWSTSVGGKAEHKTSSKVLRYAGGHGNYMLILCGSVRWQGSAYSNKCHPIPYHFYMSGRASSRVRLFPDLPP